MSQLESEVAVLRGRIAAFELQQARRKKMTRALIVAAVTMVVGFSGTWIQRVTFAKANFETALATQVHCDEFTRSADGFWHSATAKIGTTTVVGRIDRIEING